MDWEQPIDVSVFYGRVQELTKLQHLILEERCRLIVLSGMGGIGKTALVAKLQEQIKSEFDYVIGRSLRSAESFQEILCDLLEFLSDGQQKEGTVSQLLDYLRKQRCLLVLDDVETRLCAGKPPGIFQPEYEACTELIKRIRTEQHQSCLLLVSREPPQNTVALRGEKVAGVQLSGLGKDAQALLKEQSLVGTEQEFNKLIDLYGGNPLSLNLISATIQDLFDGRVMDYLVQGTIVVVTSSILEQHFARLSELETKIIGSLAVHNEPCSLQQLIEAVASRSASEVMEAVQSLVRRALIEKIPASVSGIEYTLQPEVKKYVKRTLSR